MKNITIVHVLFIILVLGACSNSTSSDSDTETPEIDLTSELDCKQLGYPCSLAEVPDEIYEKTYNALEEAFNILDEGGTMEDVVTYLTELSNMVEAELIDNTIRFRFEGGAPAFFQDVRDIVDPQQTSLNINKVNRGDYLSKSVVGEDQNDDGKVNNRDHRRAMVLAPYLWQFKPFDESPVIAERFSLMPEYAGHVFYKANSDSLNREITIEDYYSWDDYDSIFISTHGTRACWQMSNVERRCGVQISSGILVDINNSERSVRTGASLTGLYSNISNRFYEVTLTMDFFRTAYPSGLDNTLLVFSACETGDSGASELAEAIGGESFVMMGWTETVFSSAAAAVANRFLFELEFGLPANEALKKIEEAGLSPFTYTNKKGETITTHFTHFTPDGSDQRIREVIKLVDLDGPMEDGYLITVDHKNGTDHLNLNALVEGVLPDKRGDYSIRVELDGEVIGENFDLSDAKQESDYGYVVALENLNTGKILDPDKYTLEAIVDLPEGGESRYEVIVQVSSCYFNATVSGDFSGKFNGPARVSFLDEGIISIDLQSREHVNGSTGPGSFTANIGAGPNVSVPDEYPVTGGTALQFDVFSATYLPGYDPADCEQCGGTLTVDTIDDLSGDDKSITGKFEVTMPVRSPENEPDNPFLINLSANFKAVTGSSSDVNSPFTQCRITYADD